jgi:glucose uptake protein GlcU
LFFVKKINENEIYLLYVCIKTNKVMENQSNSVNHMAMSYGLYMGLALILNSVIFYVMGSPFAPVCGYISYAILITGIALSMKSFRDNNTEAGVTYGSALGLGTLQSLFASLIMAFFTFVLFKLVDKTLIDKFLSTMEEQLLSRGTPENQIDAVISMYRKVMTPLTYSLGQIFGITFFGFIFSLILSIFFKKQSTDPFHGVE